MKRSLLILLLLAACGRSEGEAPAHEASGQTAATAVADVEAARAEARNDRTGRADAAPAEGK